ncbi:hypothetical protein CLOM_g251 [Closterium sp. NIES-68]|nr:hypothetical protein CLOM_g251 [Closterium sp. NIES-68]GJP59443.1 hypothetical protein CLOP_g12239 [Closterium sp. NIES-67]
MSKAGGGGGGSALGRAAMASAAAGLAVQRQRALQQRVDADVISMVENFTNMIKASKINDPVRNSQEAYQIEVHSAKLVGAAESLLKLVAQLKQTVVFADMSALNASVERHKEEFKEEADVANEVVACVGEKATTLLHDLEDMYFTSKLK